MNLILLTKRHGPRASLDLAQPRVWLAAAAVLAAVAGALLYGGYRLGLARAGTVPAAVAERWAERLAEQDRALETLRARTRAELDALALRLGRMQAHVMRLDALGRRLTEMAELDRGEFDFSRPPAQGGPAAATAEEGEAAPELLAAIDRLARQIEDRERQLAVLEELLMERRLRREASPAGRPVRRGWLSSYYGRRTDPFTGRREHHRGVDFAGRLGSPVVAVASGIVTWSGERYGYGLMVEIDHGDGYVTRYAHNLRNLVRVGDRVQKGQTIALMGSSGRSTGPHVHFEVRYRGRVVNPLRYIRTARR